MQAASRVKRRRLARRIDPGKMFPPCDEVSSLNDEKPSGHDDSDNDDLHSRRTFLGHTPSRGREQLSHSDCRFSSRLSLNGPAARFTAQLTVRIGGLVFLLEYDSSSLYTPTFITSGLQCRSYRAYFLATCRAIGTSDRRVPRRSENRQVRTCYRGEHPKTEFMGRHILSPAHFCLILNRL